jgi:Cu/Zn superoxide dismutase
VRFPANAYRGERAEDYRRCAGGAVSRRARIRLGAGAAATALAATALAVTAPAGASTNAAARTAMPAQAAAPAAGAAYGARVRLTLRAMPVGRVSFRRDRHHHLMVRADLFGLTPGSSHAVDLWVPGRSRLVRFGPLTANSGGQAYSTLSSNFTGQWRPGSRLRIRMGVGGGRVARESIAMTRRLLRPGRRSHRLISVEVTRKGVSYGTPQGGATVVYSGSRHTLTVTVHARGVAPGRHAAHIHVGSCMSQGPVLYMLRDLIANRRGVIVHAVRVFTGVTTPIPARGWYLNIHQGNSGDILSNGQPTIFFRPLLCANIHP